MCERTPSPNSNGSVARPSYDFELYGLTIVTPRRSPVVDIDSPRTNHKLIGRRIDLVGNWNNSGHLAALLASQRRIFRSSTKPVVAPFPLGRKVVGSRIYLLPTLAEMTVDPRLKPFVDSLASSEVVSDDFVRFRPDDADNRVADLVQSAELYDDVVRADLRGLLTNEAKDTLYLFGQRRVLLGRRTSNVSYYHQALAAFSLLPEVRDIPWITWFLAALILGEYANDPDVVALFGGPATEGGMRCQELQNSLENGGSLSQCHLREVETTYGQGIIELPLPHDLPGHWSRPPMIGRDDAVYAPTINLAQLAVEVADALDRLEGTRTTALEFSFLSTGTTTSIGTLGCLHCCAIKGNNAIDVYVAELESESDAKQFVAHLSDDDGFVVRNGAELVLFSSQPSFDDNLESPPLDATAFEQLAKSAFLRI